MDQQTGMTEEAILERMDEIRQARKTFATLIALPEFKEYQKILQAQITLRRQTEFATPIHSLDAAFLSATAKAEIGALQLAINLPKIYVDDLETDLQIATQELQNLQPQEQEA